MTFSTRKSTRQLKCTFSCGFCAHFEGFESPHSDHNRENPATIVVAGFSCIHAVLRSFCGKNKSSIWWIILACAKYKCDNFRHEIRHEKPAQKWAGFITPHTTTLFPFWLPPQRPPRGSSVCRRASLLRLRPAQRMPYLR